MPRVTVQYNLPEEDGLYKAAMNGSKYHQFIEEFGSVLRTMTKYGCLDSSQLSDLEIELANKLREHYWEMYNSIMEDE